MEFCNTHVTKVQCRRSVTGVATNVEKEAKVGKFRDSGQVRLFSAALSGILHSKKSSGISPTPSASSSDVLSTATDRLTKPDAFSSVQSPVIVVDEQRCVSTAESIMTQIVPTDQQSSCIAAVTTHSSTETSKSTKPRWIHMLPKDGRNYVPSNVRVDSDRMLLLPSNGIPVVLSEEINTRRTSQLRFFKHFLSSPDDMSMFQQLLHELPWTQRSGKWGLEPRLTAWFGRSYTYSGVNWEPNVQWHPLLVQLRKRVEEFIFGPEHQFNEEPYFNSVLCNLYRTGHDSIGAHSDDEPELGKYPVIASISLGAERLFVMQVNRRCHELRLPVDELFSVSLNSGSLLIMQAATQRHWRHSVPKSQDTEPRINLTLRRILKH